MHAIDALLQGTHTDTYCTMYKQYRKGSSCCASFLFSRLFTAYEYEGWISQTELEISEIEFEISETELETSEIEPEISQIVF